MEERKLKSEIESIALVILLLVSIFFIPVVVTADDGDITIGSVFGAKSDETYAVSISLANVENITSLNATLFYDSSVIEIENIAPNISVFNSKVTSLIKDDEATIALTNTNLPDFISTIEHSPIIDVTFKVTGDPGSSTALDLEDVELTDNSSNQFFPSTVDGNATVAKLTTISITPPDASLNETETASFTATGLDQYDNQMDEITFDWSSSNETVGEVDSNGLFTASTRGSTMVDATNEDVTGSANVTVVYKQELRTINITSSSDDPLNEGETKSFFATGYDQYDNPIDGTTFIWTSSNVTVGTVDLNGLFTAVTRGRTTVYATSGEVAGSVNVEVSYIPVLETIKLNPSNASLDVGDKEQFTATGLDQYGNQMDEITFIWTSSDETVGTVSSNGRFTALELGGTMVNATNGSIVGSASVAVGYTPILTVINITPSNASLYVGDEKQFTATGRDQYDNIITGILFSWTISDGTVGTVDSNGNFKALASGRTILYAINSSAVGNANINVAVNEPAPTPTPPPLTTGGGGGGSSGGRLPMSFELKTDRYGRVQGGLTKTSSDGKAKLIIPAGTIALDVNGKPLDTVRIVPTKVGGTFVAYDLRPSGAVFKPYATFILTYDPGEVPEGTRLIVKTYEDERWVALETTVDTVKHTATAKLYHFTLFGLFEQNKAEKPRPATVQTQTQATTPTKTPSSDTPASNTIQAPEQKDRLQLPVIPWSWLMAIIIVIFIVLTMYTTYYKKR